MVEYYNSRYAELVGGGQSPGVSAVQHHDYAAAKQVCNGRTNAEVEQIVDRYLSIEDPKLRSAGYPFRWLPSRLAQVLTTQQPDIRPFPEE